MHHQPRPSVDPEALLPPAAPGHIGLCEHLALVAELHRRSGALRDELIRQARDGGEPLAAIGRITGLSPQGIKIISERDPEAGDRP